MYLQFHDSQYQNIIRSPFLRSLGNLNTKKELSENYKKPDSSSNLTLEKFLLQSVNIR